MRFKSSRYNIFVPLLNNRSLAYNSFSKSLSVWEAEEKAAYERIADVEDGKQDEQVMALARAGYLIREEIDELELVKQHYDSVRYSPGTVTVTVCPTLACNFACDYCFQGLNKSNEKMPQEVEDAIVKYYEDVADHYNGLHLAWYGGEPLIRLDIIKRLSDRLMNYATKKGKNFISSMVTNGYFLTKEVAQELFLRKVNQIQITLDGTRNQHDKRRHLHSKKGTFDTIIDNLVSWIEEVPIFVSIRVNIDERNRKDVKGLLDYMDEVGLSNQPNLKVYFAPVESMTKGCHNVSELTMQKSRYGRYETDLQRHAFEKGLAFLPYPKSFLGICSAIRPYDIIIVPNGDVHKCWDTVSFPERAVGHISNIQDSFREKDEKLELWNQWSPFKNSACSNCKILPNCAGFCAFKFVHSDEMLGEAAELPCPSWKYAIKEKLILKAEKEGHITAEDYDPDCIFTHPVDLTTDGIVHQGILHKVA